MKRYRPLLACMITSCLILSTGCISVSEVLGQKRKGTLDTSYLKQAGYSIPPGGMPKPVSPNSSHGPAIVLEVRGDENHLESIPLPANKPTFVEELVNQAQLHEKLGALSISIMRPTGPGSPPVRLDVQIDSSGKAKNVGQNYALLPGDHLVVLHDQRTYLERFIEKSLKTR